MDYTRFNRAEKIMLAKSLRDKKNRLSITNPIEQNIETKTYEQAIPILNKIDILHLFGIKANLGENFPCKIIAGNIGSVNKAEWGHYTYFSRDPVGKSNKCISLIDMYQIAYNCNHYRSVVALCQNLKIEVKEEIFIVNQKIKYADNIAIIEEANDEMKYRYPVLYKFVNKHLYILEKMNTLGIRSLCSKKEAVKANAVFFASSRYIAEDFQKNGINISPATVNKIINAFAALGLIKKVKHNKVPRHMLARGINEEEKGLLPNFYTIPTFSNSVFEEADRRAEKLTKVGMTISSISTEFEVYEDESGMTYEVVKLEEILGKRVYASVFANTDNATRFIKTSTDRQQKSLATRKENKEKNKAS